MLIIKIIFLIVMILFFVGTIEGVINRDRYKNDRDDIL